jgi:two-component system, NarL family, sensor histidine kinase UhpB
MVSLTEGVLSQGNAMQLRSTVPQLVGAMSAKFRGIGGLLLACITVQLTFWLVINPVLFASPPRPDIIAAENAELATVPNADPAGFERAKFKPVELPHSDCCGPGYRLVRMNFALDAVPADGLALIPQLGSDNFHVRVNGQWTRQDGRLNLPRPTYHGNLKTILYISPSVLKVGVNRLEFVAMRASIPYFDIGKPMLAPYAQASELLAHRNFILNDYKIISYSFGLLAAALAFLLLARSEQKRFAFWVCVVLAAWGLRYHYYTWTDPPFSGPVRMVYYFVLTLTIPVAWVNMIDAWTGRPWRWLSWLTGLIWAGIVVTFFSLLTATDAAPYDQAVTLTNGVGIVLGGLGIARFLWHFLTRRDDRYWEAALFLLCITLMILDFYGEFSGSGAKGFLVTSFPILILAFPVAFIARNIRLFRSMNEFNELLTGQLREREAELADNYARQSELARRETLVAERQRLMRDMHDGIGGQLMSLLFASRKQPMPQEELTTSLQQVIDELRLIIDSLDTVGETLGTALATFRARIEPRLSAAGIELRWDNSLPDTLDGLGPREVLQIFRIVQEAVTNVIKHANSSTLDIAIAKAEGETSSIAITIADAGQGNVAKPGEGHGIQNMTARAQSIGGSLEIVSGPTGTRLQLLVPVRAPTDASA